MSRHAEDSDKSRPLPDEVPSILERGDRFAAEGKLQEAAEHYHLVISGYPDSFPGAHHKLGSLFRRAAILTSSIHLLTDAVPIDPSAADDFFEIGDIHIETAIKTAKGYIEAALRLRP